MSKAINADITFEALKFKLRIFYAVLGPESDFQGVPGFFSMSRNSNLQLDSKFTYEVILQLEEFLRYNFLR